MKRCRYCGSPKLVTLEGPFGPHHAKVVCGECGRMDRFVPKPEGPAAAPPDDVLARVRPRERPAVLRGTPHQVRFAVALRHTLLHQARQFASPGLANLLSCVTDATWFIAQKGRTAGNLRWPSRDQVEDPGPTGTCFNCGDDAFEYQPCCSMECADAYAAFCAVATEVR